MHILIDASGLRTASPEAGSYFRGMVRHLLLAPEWHAYTILGWPQAKLGRLADFLAPLSRSATTKLIALPAAREPAVVYAPVGFPTARRDVFRFLTRGAPIATVGTVLGEESSRGARCADRVVVLTRSGMDALIEHSGLREDRVRCVPPGIDAHAPRKQAATAVQLPGTEYLATAGMGHGASPTAAKALWRVLAGFRLFRRQERRNVRLVVVGGAPFLVRQAAKSVGLAECVEFLPIRGIDGAFERALVIASAAAFVHASRPDASWLSAAEAMRHGVPIIAPRTRATREVFGDVALYYPEGSRRGIADELARLFGSEDLRRGLARHGMLRGQAYSWETSARQVLGVFDELCAAASFEEQKVGDAAGSGYNRALSSHAQTRRGNLP